MLITLPPVETMLVLLTVVVTRSVFLWRWRCRASNQRLLKDEHNLELEHEGSGIAMIGCIQQPTSRARSTLAAPRPVASNEVALYDAVIDREAIGSNLLLSRHTYSITRWTLYYVMTLGSFAATSFGKLLKRIGSIAIDLGALGKLAPEITKISLNLGKTMLNAVEP